MIDLLKKIEDKELLQLLDKPEVWHSLLIDYHPPVVHRLWTQIGEHRLFLHNISPFTREEALYHPHPSESAMHIIPTFGSTYEMGLAYSEREDFHELTHADMQTVCRLELQGDNYYEMRHINGWHYVRPIGRAVYTVMLVSKPWGRKSPKSSEPLKELSEMTVKKMLAKFKNYYTTKTIML